MTASREVFCDDPSCFGCAGCTPLGQPGTYDPDPAESIGYRPACRYPSRNYGDGRGCQMDDCPKCGGAS